MLSYRELPAGVLWIRSIMDAAYCGYCVLWTLEYRSVSVRNKCKVFLGLWRHLRLSLNLLFIRAICSSERDIDAPGVAILLDPAPPNAPWSTRRLQRAILDIRTFSTNNEVGSQAQLERGRSFYPQDFVRGVLEIRGVEFRRPPRIVASFIGMLRDSDWYCLCL